jgi:hypothetical protein
MGTQIVMSVVCDNPIVFGKNTEIYNGIIGDCLEENYVHLCIYELWTFEINLERESNFEHFFSGLIF